MNRQEREALQKVISYLWHDEQIHYQESTVSEKRTHIFKAVLILKQYSLKSRKKTKVKAYKRRR